MVAKSNADKIKGAASWNTGRHSQHQGIHGPPRRSSNIASKGHNVPRDLNDALLCRSLYLQSVLPVFL